MSFLKLNGITIPVLIDGAGQDEEELGTSARSSGANLVTHRYAFRSSWPFKVQHKDKATAFAFRNLLRGAGNVWSFEGADLATSLWSSRGVSLVTSGGDVEHYAAQKKYGSHSLFLGGGTYAQNTTLLTGLPEWSVHAWVYGGALSEWHHYIVRSDGAKWVDAVRNDALDVSWWLSTTSTTFKLLADGYDLPIDDVAVVPYLMPVDWPKALYNAGAAWGALPHHQASGDLIEFGQLAKTVKAEVEGMEIHRAGSGPLYVVKAKLKEV